MSINMPFGWCFDMVTGTPKPPRSKGRTGRPFRRLRDRLKASGAPCWVCGHHIDLSLPWWDPWSFSVDHIVPLVAGGAPLDGANVASAHRRCNQLRSYGAVPVGPAEGPVRASRAW
jgi:hypothetical protein